METLKKLFGVDRFTRNQKIANKLGLSYAKTTDQAYEQYLKDNNMPVMSIEKAAENTSDTISQLSLAQWEKNKENLLDLDSIDVLPACVKALSHALLHNENALSLTVKLKQHTPDYLMDINISEKNKKHYSKSYQLSS